MNSNAILNVGRGALRAGCVIGLMAVLAQPTPATAGGLLCRGLPGPEAEQSRVVELAICLDTSGSMSGLIQAAQQKLWAIVNDLALAEPTPKLRVALLTYGNDGHNPEDGWVTVQTPFTDDLDLVSQKLFALTTNGGTEYVGRVLQSAGQLDWMPSDSALKLILVAGNESADQDRDVPYGDMCRKLIGNGIMVNAIYCGPVADSLAPAWRQVAQLADGHFASIDQDNGTVVVETPFDGELAELSVAVNETYVPMGARGQTGLANQQAQDANAASLNSAAAATRAVTKAQSVYFCGWDLVDACRAGDVKIEELSADDLPEALRGMTVDERKAHVEELVRKRDEIQGRIKTLSDQRNAFIAEQMKDQGLDDSNAFDRVIRQAVRAQAVAKGFRFEDTTPQPEAAGGESEGS